MKRVRRTAIGLAIAVAGLAATPAPAAMPWLESWEGKVRYTVSPAPKIPLTSPVVVTWKTDRTLPRNRAYQVMWSVIPAIARTNLDPRPTGCAEKVVRLVGRGSKRGRTIRVTFDPRSVAGASAWCDSYVGGFGILPLTLDEAGKASPDLQQTLEPIATVPTYGRITLRMGGTPLPPMPGPLPLYAFPN